MKGFTLIEALVAISIISIAITAPLYSASRSMTTAQNSKYQLTASYLAQEGIEYVRKVRDKEYLSVYQAEGGAATVSADAWSGFLGGGISNINSCISPRICTLDPVVGSIPLESCAGGICNRYLYLTPGGVYTQDNTLGVVQPFIRTIQASDPLLIPNDERIVSTVTWNIRGTTYSVTVSDHLTPWQ